MIMMNSCIDDIEYLRNLIKEINRLIKKYEYRVKILSNLDKKNMLKKIYLDFKLYDDLKKVTNYESLIEYYNYIISFLIKEKIKKEKELENKNEDYTFHILSKYM